MRLLHRSCYYPSIFAMAPLFIERLPDEGEEDVDTIGVDDDIPELLPPDTPELLSDNVDGGPVVVRSALGNMTLMVASRQGGLLDRLSLTSINVPDQFRHLPLLLGDTSGGVQYDNAAADPISRDRPRRGMISYSDASLHGAGFSLVHSWLDQGLVSRAAQANRAALLDPVSDWVYRMAQNDGTWLVPQGLVPRSSRERLVWDGSTRRDHQIVMYVDDALLFLPRDADEPDGGDSECKTKKSFCSRL